MGTDSTDVTAFSRRSWLRGVAGVVLGGVGGRALGGCGGPPVSIRIRRTDGTRVGASVVVRASVIVTNHTTESHTLPMRASLVDGAGASAGELEEMITIAGSEVSCQCIEITVRNASFTTGLRVTISLGTESVTTSLDAVGTAALRSCDYTCNY